ncbi:MAG: serine/threonine-protein kinase, partial [Planctomycetota bacterium]
MARVRIATHRLSSGLGGTQDPMSNAHRLRDVLVAQIVTERGLAKASAVAAAVRRCWGGGGDAGPSFSEEILREVPIPPEELRSAVQEADRRIEEAGDDVQAALAGFAGLHRSILSAISQGSSVCSPDGRLPPPEAATVLRTLPGDRYTDFLPVGKGGMGLVYMALDTELQRMVAFKMIRPDAGRQDQADTHTSPIKAIPPSKDTPESKTFAQLTYRFLQEAWVTGGLEHPGVAPVYEMGRTANGIPYYTMRFVRGQRTLTDAIAELQGRPFGDRTGLLESFLKLCDTVSYAHSNDVVHRDLKPDNVALGDYGEVILLDWGLAKLRGQGDPSQHAWQEKIREFRTEAGLETDVVALGTPWYMSPEAALGRTDELDMRSDVYSLGTILFEILTGERPIPARGYAEYVDRITHTDPAPATSLDPAVPRALSDLCTAALARDRDRRLPDVASLARGVRRWQAASALERELDELCRKARGAIEAAESAAAEARMAHVDEAAGSLSLVLARRPSHPQAAELLQEAEALRRQGLEEREEQRQQEMGAVRRARIHRALRVLGLVLVVLGGIRFAQWLGTEYERAKELRMQREA